MTAFLVAIASVYAVQYAGYSLSTSEGLGITALTFLAAQYVIAYLRGKIRS
jgi:hypothetical protein